MKKIGLLLFIFIIINCSDKAHITWDTELYPNEFRVEQNFSMVDENDGMKEKDKIQIIPAQTPIATLKKGDIVTALDYRWHGWSVRNSIKVQTGDGKIGWISARSAVIGQDPKNSVYTWGSRPDYKYFYDPNDKEHFPKGFEHPALKNLSKERIPFDKISEGLATGNN